MLSLSLVANLHLHYFERASSQSMGRAVPYANDQCQICASSSVLFTSVSMFMQWMEIRYERFFIGFILRRRRREATHSPLRGSQRANL
jgi:hypothetical protein